MTDDIRRRADSLRGAVAFGLENGKRNVIADLDVLEAMFRGLVPVGGNELPPQEVTARLYALKEEYVRLRFSALKLCRELQCPAMEYLNRAVQNAWSELFNLVEAKGTADGPALVG